jgi:hypothetical protein
MQIGIHWMERIFLGTATLSALVFGAGIASATQDVVLTAVKGDASIQDRDLGGRAELGDDQALQTGGDGGCSVLVDRNAVVELCGQTRISFAKDAKRGNRIVNVESGELRLVVEPREVNERIEIHTPAAIATILGTVVYVSVDPLTGATTISSSESQVNIRAQGGEECVPRGLPVEPGIPECAKGTTIGDLEQLTIVPGERAQSVKQLNQQQIDELSGCLLDFHDLALNADRLPQENRATERVLAVDIAAVLLPPVAQEAAEAAAAPVETGADPETEVELNPTDDRDQEKEITDDLMMMDVPPSEPPCGGIPGEHCGF